ncbi:MAG: ABC-F family ATP-binding cassette domain-containing protein [Chloroflexi bacterium]|nr:ABC-F family ATP-binding cassette domain-containing protein [Chloroflexota bacterium]
MSLLVASNLSKSFGHIDIFSGLTFSVERGARMALVGPNGAGKTTLLRILIGEEEASAGRVTRAKRLRIGYLPQEAEFESQSTLWDECLDVFSGLQKQQAELSRLEALMADPGHAEAALVKYGALQEDFERKGGYTYQTRIRQVLTGLGFSSDDYGMPLDHLSGGQRTRALLARLLLSDPDLLLLDEPTNHLDIAAVEWLEGYLSQWGGAAVIVSHDRYFLDKVANGILEMTAAGVETYRGNYSHYVRQRQERWARRQQVFEAEKEKLLKEAAYIRKNIAGQNVSQARGKLRRLSRIVQAIEQVGMETVLNKKWIEVSRDVAIATSDLSPDEAERRVRALRLPDHRPPQLNLRLRAESRSGEKVIRTHDLLVGYAGRPLFRAPDIELLRTDCAALIGPNGAGKTTFLKTILGQLEPLAGEVVLGASLHIGYFAQAHEGLDPRKTLMQEIQLAAPNMLPASVRGYLARYLFSGDDVFKTVAMLSGGERGRLALAKLALQDTNLLLLDEPTNHLDIPSQEILQEVLDVYTGTILLVTHDRYLIDALATQIWEIDPDESRLSVFKGTYSQMRAEREKQAARAAAEAESAARKTGAGRSPRRDPAQKAERRRLARLQEVENLVAALETRLAELARQLENPPADPDEVRRLGEEYAAVQAEMDERLGEWEALES